MKAGPDQVLHLKCFFPAGRLKVVNLTSEEIEYFPGAAILYCLLMMKNPWLILARLSLKEWATRLRDIPAALRHWRVSKRPRKNLTLLLQTILCQKCKAWNWQKKILEIRRNIPVMLCTGTKSDQLVDHAKDAGIIEVIQKPIPLKTLIKAINNILAKQ